MRLIDADLLKIDFINKACGIKDKRTNIQIIEDAPTIEAIPIEWIINHPKYPKKEDKAKVIEDMIADWKEENGYVNN